MIGPFHALFSALSQSPDETQNRIRREIILIKCSPYTRCYFKRWALQ